MLLLWWNAAVTVLLNSSGLVVYFIFRDIKHSPAGWQQISSCRVTKCTGVVLKSVLGKAFQTYKSLKSSDVLNDFVCDVGILESSICDWDNTEELVRTGSSAEGLELTGRGDVDPELLSGPAHSECGSADAENNVLIPTINPHNDDWLLWNIVILLTFSKRSVWQVGTCDHAGTHKLRREWIRAPRETSSRRLNYVWRRWN